MMTLCGLKVILSPGPVPSILRYGPNGVMVVSPREYAELAVAGSCPGSHSEVLVSLLQEHRAYQRSRI
jgi:hypothetical protein